MKTNSLMFDFVFPSTIPDYGVILSFCNGYEKKILVLVRAMNTKLKLHMNVHQF